MSLDKMGTVLSSEVLIIGHGLAGIALALFMKEKNPDVDILLVDKASTGYGGKANKGACVIIDVAKDATAEEVVEWHVRNSGEYLNNQDLYLDFIRNMPGIINKLEQWGINITREEDGQPRYFPGFPSPWQLTTIEYDFLIKMSARAKKLGCKFMDKISVTDLLTQDNKVAGAVGFSLITGEKYIFKAKSVVIANGNQDYRAIGMWDCARGDSIAAAYRAGVEMRNAEFGTFRQAMYADVKEVPLTAEDHLYNAKGEWISPKYRPWLNNKEDMKPYMGTMIYDSNAQLFDGMYREVLAGNGPIYFDAREYQAPARLYRYAMDNSFWERPKWTRWTGMLLDDVNKGMTSESPLIPVTAGLIGEQSPIKVDNEMKTSMEGLWCIGDACYNGSGVPGAVPAPPARLRGSGLAFALYSALNASSSVVECTKSATAAKIDDGQADMLINDFMAPLQRKSGYNPNEICANIRKIMAQMKYTGNVDEAAMKEGLSLVEKERDKLSEVSAKDYHYMSAANEARSFVICAESHFKSAMRRKETRGWFMRTDYPERDDKNCLVYYNFKYDPKTKNVEEWEEKVPIEKYPYQPE